MATGRTKPGSYGDKNEKDELRIVLVGSAGAGKSATGNSILGENKFVSKVSPKSVTTECAKEECDRNGRHLVVIDTPGFFDKKTPDEKVQSDLRQCLDLCRPGPHAIVLVIQTGRFTEEEEESVEQIQRVFGEEALKQMIIVFSRKEDLGNQSIKAFINEAEPKLREIIKKCGNNFCAFNNNATGDENNQQVSELIEMIDRMNESCFDKLPSLKPFFSNDLVIGTALGFAVGIAVTVVSFLFYDRRWPLREDFVRELAEELCRCCTSNGLGDRNLLHVYFQ